MNPLTDDPTTKPSESTLNNMDLNELLEVYSTDDPYDADVVLAEMRGLNIRCVAQNERQGGFVGLNVAPIRVFVRAIDFDLARAQVEGWERQRA